MSKKTKKPLSFEDWLRLVPTLQDSNEEEITVEVPVTLPASTWLSIAHVAAMHGETIEEAVVQMVYDVSVEDDFMNEPRHHLWEVREEHNKKCDERDEKRAKEQEEAQSERDKTRKELLDDVTAADWWKKQQEENGGEA